jgi:hypothetical protein
MTERVSLRHDREAKRTSRLRQQPTGPDHNPICLGDQAMAKGQSICVASRRNHLAYWDSRSGLVQVRVLAIVGDGNAHVDRLSLDDAKVLFEVTANRGPYRRREILSSKPLHGWSRQHVRRSRRGPSHVVVQPHDWRELLRPDHE